MTTRAILREQTYTRLGLPTTDGLITPAVVNSAIDTALQRISTEGDWPWLWDTWSVPLVVEQAAYLFPDRTLRVLSVQIGARDLKPAQVRELARWSLAPGLPVLFAVDGNNLVLAPAPASADPAQVRRVRAEPPLAADTASPLLPPSFHDYLVCHAARLLAVRRRDRDLAADLAAEIRDWRATLRIHSRRMAGFPLPQTRTDWGA